MRSQYEETLELSLVPKLASLGFTRIQLKGCMRPEVLMRKGALWFGTSWDYRDQYLELNLGGLYWLRDVMPRVVVLGDYSNHCGTIKRLSPTTPNYLEDVSEAVAGSIEKVLGDPDGIQDSEARSVARLRALLISKVLDEELENFRAA